jgi:hypothetical protein
MDAYTGQTVTITRRADTYNVTGEPNFSTGASASARVEQRDRIVRGPEGQEVLSTSRAYLDAGTVLEPGDKITYGTDTREVVSVYRGRGLDAETHVVAYLR